MTVTKLLRRLLAFQCLGATPTHKGIYVIMLFSLSLILSAPNNASDFYQDQLMAPAAEVTPNLSLLDNGKIRVGIDSSRGGSITYLSLSNSNESIINVFDMGREVQLSFYSGPANYEPKPRSTKCKSKWRPEGNWPWNPIGAGDVAGHSGQVVDLRNDGESVYVKSIPLQWSCDYVPCECSFEKWISLDQNAVNVHARLINNRSDRTQYAGKNQELPAIYVNGPFYRLITYNETKPFTNDTLTELNTQGKIWTPGTFLASEHWASLVNDSMWGLGVFHPDTSRISGGFAGRPGNYGPSASNTGYMAPNHIEILDYNIVYDFNFTLILGHVQDIRNYVYNKRHDSGPCLNYHFVKDRQHFSFVNAADKGIPHGIWTLVMESNDPQAIGPMCLWMAEEYPKLYINASFSSNLKGKSGQVFFNAGHFTSPFEEAHSVSFPVIADDLYHVYEVNMAANSLYKGPLFGIRFDPVDAGMPGAYANIGSLSVLAPS